MADGWRSAFRRLAAPLRWLCGAKTDARGSEAAGREWESAVGGIVEILTGLNGSTERDFLSVGEKLMEFRLGARQISSEMATLTELISGEQGSNASLALTRMLEHSKALDTRIEQSGRVLEQVRGLSSRIGSSFAGLSQTKLVFRTLCTLTRIESSRLGSSGADLVDLATEVAPLSERVRSSGEHVREEAQRLDEAVQLNIRRSSDLRERQLKELAALIADVNGSLQAFEERRRQAVESSARQAEQYAGLCDAVDGVVRSIQFHDITRQQIEHVAQALEQVRAENGGKGGRRRKLTADSRAVLALQNSQLLGAGRIFTASIEQMESDLKSIAARVQDTAEAGSSLMGASADDQSSFFLEMKNQFTGILGLLSSCDTEQAEMESTVATLEGSVVGMRDSVAEIREVEIRIQRIAINATIRASHMGAIGDPLNVIAEVMQRLSSESCANTDDVSQTLDAMSTAAGSMSGARGGKGAGAPSDTNAVLEQMRGTVADLEASSECSIDRVEQINALSAKLARDIGVVRSGFSAGQLFTEAVGRACAGLERITGAGARESSCMEAESTTTLENLAKRYTMQIERDVHESIATGAAINLAMPAAMTAVALEEGDFGDNVELF